uniref:SFRICE_007500 n=1 Tax=Spodoptera frugiperda TaxID=7108 RepID=A0A2H1VTN6_SPOFR
MVIFKANYNLIPLPTGRYLLNIGNYTYSTNRVNFDGQSTWYCSQRVIFFLTSRGKKGMIYKNEKYYSQIEPHGTRWRCTKRGCKAYYLETNGVIRRKQEEHTHPLRLCLDNLCNGSRGSYTKHPNHYTDNAIQYRISKRGHRMLLINGYTFTKNTETNHKTRWRCSIRTCSARVHTIEDVVVLALLEHKHPPKAHEKSFTTNLSLDNVYELDDD